LVFSSHKVYNGDIGHFNDVEPEVGAHGEVSMAAQLATASANSTCWRRHTPSLSTRARARNTRRSSFRC
jgi:hypothetical protein